MYVSPRVGLINFPRYLTKQLVANNDRIYNTNNLTTCYLENDKSNNAGVLILPLHSTVLHFILLHHKKTTRLIVHLLCHWTTWRVLCSILYSTTCNSTENIYFNEKTLTAKMSTLANWVMTVDWLKCFQMRPDTHKASNLFLKFSGIA